MKYRLPNEPGKYLNKRSESSDGRVFASKKERDRYNQLLLLEKAHWPDNIRNLRCQVPFRLIVNGHFVCKYLADFTYEEANPTYPPGGDMWKSIVEDAKGARTREYLIKRKLMKAVHGIDVRET